MAPVPVLDYIIIHEMVHLKYPNHSPEFWNELDKKMPNYREHEKSWVDLSLFFYLRNRRDSQVYRELFGLGLQNTMYTDDCPVASSNKWSLCPFREEL
jgi:hypothetical protein